MLLLPIFFLMSKNTQLKPNILLKRQEDQELRIYFFIGDRPTSLLPGQRSQSDKRVISVTGFKLEDAFGLAKVKGEGFNLMFTSQSPTVREFLHELELESLAHQLPKEKLKIEIKEDPLPQPAKQSSPAQLDFNQFKAGLLFCANEKKIIYQESKDQENLKRIISGLSCKD